MMYLRQSTASQSVLIGPFVDESDGVTAEDSLTIANTDIRLSANGGNMAAKNSGGGTHDELGYYTITLDATDTATVGRLQLAATVSGALPVYHTFQVLEEAIYDALFAASATGLLPANVTQWSGTNVASPATAGYPAVTIKSGTGTGEINLSSGNLAGSVASVAGAVGSVTGNVGGNVTGSVGSVTGGINTGAGVITTLDGLDTAQDSQHSTTQSAIATVDGKADDILDDTSTALVSQHVFTQALIKQLVPAITVVGSTGNTTTTVHLDGGTWGDDEIVDRLLILFDNNELEFHTRWVEAWDLSSELATVAELPFTPSAGNSDNWTLSTIRRQDLSGVTAGIAYAQNQLLGLVPKSLTTIGSTGNDTTHVHLSTLTYGDDEINNMMLVIYDDSEQEYHARWITDWVSSSGLATVATLPFTPEDGVDKYWLLTMRQDVTGGSGLDAAGVRAAVGLASANLDTQLGDIPTVSEFNARTLAAADYFDPAADTVASVTAVGSVTGNVGGIAGTIQTLDALDTAQDTQHGTTQSAISGLNNLSSAQAQTAAAAALTAYDPPTKAELDTAQSAIQTDIGNLNNLDSTAVQAAANAAIVANHLDHLLAADYDPASKPGVSTALLNELIESDGGVSRYTANALEQAPSGGGGSDPWETDLSSGYSGTQAGKILSDILVDTGTTLPAAIAAIDAGTGSGARTVTITVDDGADPVQNARVRLTEGSNTYIGLTDASGDVTFNVDDATYTVAISKTGYSYAGTTIVVNGDETATYSMTAVTYSDPLAEGLITGYAYCRGSDGAVESGVVVNIKMVRRPDGGTGNNYDPAPLQITSDETGLIEHTGMVPGATYRIYRNGFETKGQTILISANAVSPVALADSL